MIHAKILRSNEAKIKLSEVYLTGSCLCGRLPILTRGETVTAGGKPLPHSFGSPKYDFGDAVTAAGNLWPCSVRGFPIIVSVLAITERLQLNLPKNQFAGKFKKI